MSEAATNLEGLLREALIPIEPPEGLAERLESTLTSITEMAADELEAWELSAMRDPRNWVRPTAALVAGGAAASALVLLRARRRAAHSRRGLGGGVDLTSLGRTAESALRDLESEARKLLGDR
ncbi:MAG TPA: hypothetical protein VFW29_02175 [Solirubrobacteraceae bacterium]|nr:hypothetical protein [Solirubrobacteraceae bacterium]